MRFNKLDMNQLVVLDALLTERSVTRAAERLFLSQPAVSCALGRLRDYYADDLLVRVGKTMVLTPLAGELVKPVRDVLLQVQAIATVKPSFDPSTSDRKIVIETSDYVMHTMLPEALCIAVDEAPGMQFDLRIVSTKAREHLDNGEIDFLICPEFFVAPGHPSQVLFEDTFCCMAWDQNEAVTNTLSLEQYLSMSHVVVQWGERRLPVIDEIVVTRADMRRHHAVIAPTLLLLPSLMAGTQHLTTIHTRLARHLVQRCPLKVVPCPLEVPNIVECVQWHKYQEHDPALLWFRNLLARASARLPPIDR